MNFILFPKKESMYKKLILDFIAKKKDDLQKIRKSIPLVCQDFCFRFMVPILPEVTLTSPIETIHFINELEIELMDLLIELFQNIKKTSSALDLTELVWTFLSEYNELVPEMENDIGLNIILTFIIQIYIDHIQFVKTYSKDKKDILYINTIDTLSKKFELYSTRMNPSTMELLQSLSALYDQILKNKELPELESINLQNLFYQLSLFAPVASTEVSSSSVPSFSSAISFNSTPSIPSFNSTPSIPSVSSTGSSFSASPSVNSTSFKVSSNQSPSSVPFSSKPNPFQMSFTKPCTKSDKTNPTIDENFDFYN
jgi:hypothetical protein